MVNVLKHQMNSFLLSEYLDKVHQVWVLQHLQRNFTINCTYINYMHCNIGIQQAVISEFFLSSQYLLEILLAAAQVKETFYSY